MIVLYGEKYASSGVFFQIKLIVNFFTVISYGPLLLAIGGQKFYYNVHMFGAIILILLEAMAIYFFESAYLITIISVICQVGRIMFMLGFIAKYFKISITNLIPLKLIFELTIPALIILYFLKFLIINFVELKPLPILIISFIIYCPLFFLWTNFRGIDYRALITPLLKKVKK
ncbi:membrane hypothetical protein [Sphingobacterium sp. PM2-P1-29]|nr:membrane hypothetical protein [Sphingobacterium sp. PM2-P1-29]